MPTNGIDPFACDIDQALEAAWLRRSVPPAIFGLVAAIVDRLFAEDAKTPESTT